MPQLLRAALDALLPPGSIWSPADGYDFDLLLDGMADNAEAVRAFLAQLARVRDPMLTMILDDLEREYGILPDSRIPEDVRRQRLFAVKTDGNSNGTAEWLQDILRTAGFDVYVHINNPAVDPAQFLGYGETPQFAGDAAGAQFGPTGQYFVSKGGDLLVNGPIYYNQSLVTYDSPAASHFWPLIFFIGGEATRDVDGSLLSMDWAQVPILRKAEFVRLIVKYKPLFTWVGMKIDYIGGI